MSSWNSKRKYSEDEKHQLLINLDIEVAHRTNQFKAWLADALENFTIHQEGHVLRIPKQVRGMTMRQFGEKYNGNVQAALRGVQTERLVAAGMDAGFGSGADKSTRKRKWLASQESTEAVASSLKLGEGKGEGELWKGIISSNSTINAKEGWGVIRRTRPHPAISPAIDHEQYAKHCELNFFFQIIDISCPQEPQSRVIPRIPPSPSPKKTQKRPPFVTSGFNRGTPSRSTSPVKIQKPPPPLARVPSSSTFNPSLPEKSRGPIYPGMPARLPRRDESMLSTNGSPLANPYELGLAWFRQPLLDRDGGGILKPDGQQEKTIKRPNSIIVHRDPSVTSGGSFHSRTTSQASLFTSRVSSSHSSTSSEATQDETFMDDKHSQPYAVTNSAARGTPRPPRAYSVVAIQTKDGHLLEFDPLQTSPGSVDALEGITDSAKKHAKEEMIQLMQTAMDKWHIR